MKLFQPVSQWAKTAVKVLYEFLCLYCVFLVRRTNALCSILPRPGHRGGRSASAWTVAPLCLGLTPGCWSEAKVPEGSLRKCNISHQYLPVWFHLGSGSGEIKAMQTQFLTMSGVTLSHEGAQAGQSCRSTAACPYCPVGHEPSSVTRAATPYWCTSTGNWKVLVLFNKQTLDPNIPISVCSLASTRLHSPPHFRHKPLFLWRTDAQPLSWRNPPFPGHSMVPIGISQSLLWFPHSKAQRAKFMMLTFNLPFLKYSFLLETF